jgi:hypothetical protein
MRQLGRRETILPAGLFEPEETFPPLSINLPGIKLVNRRILLARDIERVERGTPNRDPPGLVH